jgi:hypothetical protein
MNKEEKNRMLFSSIHERLCGFLGYYRFLPVKGFFLKKFLAFLNFSPEGYYPYYLIFLCWLG